MQAPQSPRSPRRALSPEEKVAKAKHYRLDIKEFGAHLKHLVKVYNAINALGAALGAGGKGSVVRFPYAGVQGGALQFTSRDLKSAQAKMGSAIKELKEYFRYSLKKLRDPFSIKDFKGVFSPVYARGPLVQWFNNAAAGFGEVDPSRPGSPLLMDQLPLVKQGLVIRNTITMLFFTYAHKMNLQDPDNGQLARPDEQMLTYFAGEIPAAYISFKDPASPKNSVKMLQSTAIAAKQLDGPANTFSVTVNNFPPGRLGFDKDKKLTVDRSFHPELYNNYFFQVFASLNYGGIGDLEREGTPEAQSVIARLYDEATRQGMLNEHQIVKQTSQIWKALLEPGRKVKRDQKKKEKDAAKSPAKLMGQA